MGGGNHRVGDESRTVVSHYSRRTSCVSTLHHPDPNPGLHPTKLKCRALRCSRRSRGVLEARRRRRRCMGVYPDVRGLELFESKRGWVLVPWFVTVNWEIGPGTLTPGSSSVSKRLRDVLRRDSRRTSTVPEGPRPTDLRRLPSDETRPATPVSVRVGHSGQRREGRVPNGPRRIRKEDGSRVGGSSTGLVVKKGPGGSRAGLPETRPWRRLLESPCCLRPRRLTARGLGRTGSRGFGVPL